MHIVKSLHSGLLHKTYQHFGKSYFTASVLWGFDLVSGEPILEQDLWQSITEMLDGGELFDAGLPKQNAEFLVYGHCYAPGREPVNASRVKVSFGELNKELNVFGDRHWIKGLGIGWGVSDPVPFAEMEVSYKRAFGGNNHPENPLGIGIEEIIIDEEGQIPLPNIEYPDQLIGSPGDRPKAASLNRVDLLAEQRMALGGTYDQAYIEKRLPGFPDDLNFDFFNDGAPDQWREGLFNGDESYEIINMNRDQPIIRGKIPPVYGRCFVDHRVDGAVQFKEIKTALDTVWFFPSARLGILIHRGTIEVSEKDGTDIEKLIVANENIIDAPRKPTHYQIELERRTDTAQAYKYLLNSAPLIPQGMICGFEAMQQNSDFPLELIANSNMSNFSGANKQEMTDSMDEQIELMKQQMKESGSDMASIDEVLRKLKAGEMSGELPAEYQQIPMLLNKVAPKMADDPTRINISKIDFDAMDELKALFEKISNDKKQEVRIQLESQLDEIKKLEGDNSQQIKKLEDVLIDMDLPPILPRIDEAGMLAQMHQQRQALDKQLVMMQSMGMSTEAIAEYRDKVDFAKLEKMTLDGMQQGKESYRVSAHFIEKARSPHADQEESIRAQLLESYKTGNKTSAGDYAFVDLSDLDLSGIDLSGSYLEYANLTNTNLSGANLSKTVLTHATLHKTNLTKVNLSDANLGASDFYQAQVIDSNLTNALLGKSVIRQSMFQRCKMAEKMDLFLETQFQETSFIDCDMRQLIFIDTDISGSEFIECDLTKSSFLNPVANRVKFTGSKLNGVTFVNIVGSEANFDGAEMEKVGFVGGADLIGSSFCGANVIGSNLRECNLQKARFTESKISGSDFGGANLREADFSRVDGTGAQFNKADMSFAVLERANLMEGSMYETIISGARLIDANLYCVNFMGCTVGDTDFSGAYLAKTLFKDWRPS